MWIVSPATGIDLQPQTRSLNNFYHYKGFIFKTQCFFHKKETGIFTARLQFHK